MTEDEDTLICDKCEKEIDPEGDYCWGHEEDCPNYGKNNLVEDCYCDLNFHPECCPECNRGQNDKAH